jgi:DNA-binding transcriptional regulator YiaG
MADQDQGDRESSIRVIDVTRRSPQENLRDPPRFRPSPPLTILNEAYRHLSPERKAEEDAKAQAALDAQDPSPCMACGGPVARTLETYPYDALPSVTLVDMPIEHCPACNETDYVLPRLALLLETIARRIITKEGPLAGAEVGFLRRFLDLDNQELAQRLAVKTYELRYWEADQHGEPEPRCDLLLRLYASSSGRFQGDIPRPPLPGPNGPPLPAPYVALTPAPPLAFTLRPSDW